METFEQPAVLLARLRASDRGCVVLDMQMPVFNGLELQKALFDRGILLPLIFVSGSAPSRSSGWARRRSCSA